MALIVCPECAREISSEAEACPGCGYPLAKKMRIEAEENRIAIKAAQISSTPQHLMESLARKESALVRIAVAGNPSTPLKVLQELARDKDARVREAAVNNPSF